VPGRSVCTGQRKARSHLRCKSLAASLLSDIAGVAWPGFPPTREVSAVGAALRFLAGFGCRRDVGGL
jgi:hypothetical protein